MSKLENYDFLLSTTLKKETKIRIYLQLNFIFLKYIAMVYVEIKVRRLQSYLLYIPMNYTDNQFSMIEAEPGNKNSLDFSLGGLLEDGGAAEEVSEKCVPLKDQDYFKKQGSFMRDLQKMEKSLSYQSNPYSIYQNQEFQGESTHNLEVKNEETCGKSINNTKGTSTFQKPVESGLFYLIVDFKQETLNTNVQVIDLQNGSDILEIKKSMLRSTEQSLNFQHNQLVDDMQKVTQNKKKRVKKSKPKETQRSISKSSKKQNSKKQKLRFHENKSKNQTTKKRSISLKINNTKKKMQTKKVNESPTKKQEAFHEYFGFSERMPEFQKQRSKQKKSALKKRKVVLSQKCLKVNNI